MKQVVFRYSLYAIIAILVLTAIHVFLLLPNMNYDAAEVAGYLTMTLSMVFIFFGIRHYRDRVNNGSLSFGQGLKTGLLIALGPALFFALFDLLYVKVLNPSWSDDYYDYYIKKVTVSTPPDQLQAKLASLQADKEFFSQPMMLFLIMFATVFIIGAIITIISALTLRRTKTS